MTKPSLTFTLDQKRRRLLRAPTTRAELVLVTNASETETGSGFDDLLTKAVQRHGVKPTPEQIQQIAATTVKLDEGATESRPNREK